MWSIIGLGNPGTKYALTRHNIGFMTVDTLARSWGGSLDKTEHKALTLKLKVEDQDIILAKPQTYMNLSGESVVPLMNYYKVSNSQLIVVHDEIDLPFGRLKIQQNRGAGGHNGIKSISEQLGHQDYIRIKMGVGRPSNPRVPVVDFVLQNFSNEEQAGLSDFLNLAGDAIESIVFEGVNKAASRFNAKSENSTPPGTTKE